MFSLAPRQSFGFTRGLGYGFSIAITLTCLTAFGQNTDLQGGSLRALVESRDEAVLSSLVPGKLIKLNVESSDTVTKGQPLAQIDCRARRAALKAAQTDHKQATLVFENNQNLMALDAISELDLELAAVDVERKRVEVEIEQIQTNDCILYAPYDGIVVKTLTKQYEYVEIGQPIIELISNAPPKMMIVLPSSWLAWLEVGTALDVTLDEIPGTHGAKISKLGVRVDPVSQLVEVEAEFGQHPAGLIPGMSGSILIDQPS
ncbi:MAG: efflux RND transporter periplasmic adaptor subunit [Pseudomonadota bacterium]